MIRRCTIRRYAELSGYTADAIEMKIRRGQWTLGQQFHRAPDGRRQSGVDRLRVYCEPKNGADGGPHYLDEEFNTREEAEKRAQEMEDCGIGHYWRISVRQK